MAAVSVTCTSLAEPAVAQDTREASCLTQTIKSAIADEKQFGLNGAILVADRSGQIIWAESNGIADLSTQSEFTLDTAVDIGSVAKSFAAAAVMRLVKDGRLSLQEPIASVLPDVPLDKRKITIHNLLTHSAGFPDAYDEAYAKTSREQLEKSILAQPLIHEPGAEYAYSDMGYALAEAIVERVSEMPYQEFVRTQLLIPFGLEKTGFLDAPIWAFNGGEVAVARGYTNDEERDSPVQMPRHKWTPLGGGTLISTVGDGLKWLHGLLSDSILGDGAANQIFDKHAEVRPDVIWYGYGWTIIQSPSRGTVFAHSGATSSHNFYVQYLADHGIYVVTSGNRIDGEYVDKNQNGSIEDDEILSERIHGIELGSAIAVAIGKALSK